ncbi:MAG TPA: S8 family serine peptidase [Pseudonocardiaceae bacterium]
MRPMTLLSAAAAVLATVLAGAPAVAQPQAPAPARATVSAELAATVAATPAGEPVRALLMLPNAEKLSGDRDEVVATLRAHADHTQAGVRAALEDTDATVLNRFWIGNMLLVEFPASAATLDRLASTPGVTEVTPNFTVSVPETTASVSAATNTEVTWGLQKIGAQRVWDELGVDGSGVRVATLDTGVDISHPDLAGRMVTDDPSDPRYPGGWMEFNSTGGLVSSAPRDSQYHGTHVSGTIHGSATSGTAIGVAPGAELMHGLVIPGGSGSFAQVAAGMQWAIAPTDAAGNPAGEPADVVNMSLGGNGFQAAMVAPTRAMRAAGVFPAFAIGNNCGTLGTASPGNVYEAVGVGATDEADNVASFSCGAVVRRNQWTSPPADWPESWVKPNVSAPGVDVVSASPGGGYRTLDGTSMATPHTAGTVALMLSAAGGLSIDEVVDVLGDTAFWDDRYAAQPPDTRFGIGRIHAYEATRLVALDSGVEGIVTSGGEPVGGVTVTVNPGGRRVVTGDDGRYTTRLAPGTYDLTASAFGYQDGTVTGVTVTEGGFATADIALTSLPRGSITGRATLDESGHGIPGVTVSVLDVPTPFTTTTATDGTYRIDGVPVGDYRVAATAAKFQAPQPVAVAVTEGAAATADFGFGVPPDSVAIVDSAASRAEEYRDVVFAPRGIATSIYTWAQLAQAAQHKTVILGYGVSTNYNAANFQAFLDATDANGTGVIFTDHAFSTGNGIRQLSMHTDQPVSTGFNSSGSNSAESYYQVTEAHPLLGDRVPGDRIVIDNSTQAKWVAWFTGYGGENRRTIGNLGRTADGILGGGIGVDERANNRHVLLSTHGVSGTRGPADWTPEATDLFLDAITWASPPPVPNQPYFALHDLRVDPDVVRVDQPVTVSAGIKNVGGSTGSYNVVLQVAGQPATTTPVTLAAGADTRVTWTVRRDQLGTVAVRVEHLADQFRVRAPIISLSASTVDAPGAAAVSALSAATVELLDGTELVPIGRTDDTGRLAFEIPDPAGTYTLVVWRDRTADSPGYLLHRRITIIDDGAVAFAPRVLAAGETVPGDVGENLAVRATVRLDATDSRHTGSVFVRPAATAPHGFRHEPGALVATLDRYEAVTVHAVRHLEQDWWLPSRVLGGIDWTAPFDTTFAFGAGAVPTLDDVDVSADGTVTVAWDVKDGHGNPFATVLATDLRPFVTLPAVTRLESVEGLLRAAVPNELKPILRLFDPAGTPVRAGTVDWTARPFTFTLPEDAPDGRYRLSLEAPTGGYDGTVTASTHLWAGDPAPLVGLTADRPASLAAGTETRYTVAATNTGVADATGLGWTVTLTRAAGAVDRRDVTLRLDTGRGWQRISLNDNGSGGLTATVAGGIAIPVGATRTWRMSLEIRGATDAYTITDRFAGAGVDVTDADTITLTRGRAAVAVPVAALAVG